MDLEESFRDLFENVLACKIDEIAETTAEKTINRMKGHKRVRDELTQKQHRLEKLDEQLAELEAELEKEQSILKKQKKAIADILETKDELRRTLKTLLKRRTTNLTNLTTDEIKDVQCLVDKVDHLEEIVYNRELE